MAQQQSGILAGPGRSAPFLTLAVRPGADDAARVHGLPRPDRFVDGTENPDADERAQFVIVGDEDPTNAGGSYVTTQRYVTDFARWNASSTENQEAAIGRTKASVTEEMLERTFVADAEGVYDRLVDFSTPVTGTNFFAPSLDVLESLAGAPADGGAASAAAATLGIGDLRGRNVL